MHSCPPADSFALNARWTRLLFASLACWALSACSGESISNAGCQSNRDCNAGEICIAGSCQAPGGRSNQCDDNGDCDQGEFCDIVDRTCKPLGGNVPDAGPNGTDATNPGDDASVSNPDGGTPGGDGGGNNSCTMDSDCGPQPQNICQANQCVLGCNEAGGLVCTGGTQCDTATGHCVTPNANCNNDNECMPGPPTQICVNQSCVFGCGVDSTMCQMGVEVCDTNTGRCVPLNTRCMNDSECMPGPPDQVCEGNQCVPGCTQPAGIQCSGATPNCNATTGRCEAQPPCMLDSECGDPTMICVNMMCMPRCDAPGAPACPANQVCNPEDGRCAMGGIPLGGTCSFDAQCTTDFCLGLNQNMMVVEFCSQPCGATTDCPTDFGCVNVAGMGFCVAEGFFMPAATFDTAPGGMCTDMNNTCQSGVCNLGNNMCMQRCSANRDCANFGNNCWMWTQMGMNGPNYAPLCVSQPGAAAGAACQQNSDCMSGLCNRYTNQCAELCCSESDCGANQNCTVYDVDQTTGDILKVCNTPAMPGAGQLGATCTMASDCESGACAPTDPSDMNSPRKCSTTCCRNQDCTQLPAGGVCRPFGGPMVGMTQTIVGLCIPN